MGRKIISRVGERYGMLTVIEQGPQVQYATQSENTWICQCECGNMTTVPVSNLRRIKSCGCYKPPRTKAETPKPPVKRKQAPRQPPKVTCDKCRFYCRSMGTCDYILIKEKRRPCPFGPDCTVGEAGVMPKKSL